MAGAAAASELDRSKRLDIESLRAVAILLVVVFHAFPGALPGGFTGVDVFFVISGFLITTQLAREATSTGRLRLARFWSRRAKRLLPATAVVLIVCSVLTATTLAVTQRADFAGDIVAAGLYLVNWRLAWRSVDYAAQDVGVSPVQHFWSLAVEEQFYIVWPLLIGLVLLLPARRAFDRQVRLAVGIGVVSVASLVYSIVRTFTSQADAFFITTTRLWELGIGALGALGVPLAARLSAEARRVLAVVGLATLAVVAAFARDDVEWPGWRAAVPCLATLALVWAGTRAADATGPGPLRLLSLRPMVWVGGLSYSWYLWHWPVLVGARAAFPDLSPLATGLVAAGSLLPAYLTHRFVENPIRYAPPLSRSPVKALAVGLACTVVSVASGVAVGGRPAPQSPAPEIPSASTPGTEQGRDWAEILARKTYPTISPDPSLADEDLPESYAGDCRQDVVGVEPRECVAGDESATEVVAIVGDSFMEQWEPALDAIGAREGIKFVGYFKSSCPWTLAPLNPGFDTTKLYPQCADWSRRVAELLVKHKPSAVITSGWTSLALSDAKDPASKQVQQSMTAGVLPLWKQVSAAGVPVAVLGRNPDGSTDYVSIPECVAQNTNDVTRCSFTPDRTTSDWQRATAERAGAGVSYLDIGQWVCAPASCPPVIDGVLVYRQTTHLTATFVKTLADPLWGRLRTVLQR